MKLVDPDKLKFKNYKIVDFKLDTSIVARRSTLHIIKGYGKKCEETTTSCPPKQSAYPYSETDPDCRPFFKLPAEIPYSEESARMQYLRTKPVCYIVFGKPGLEVEQVAEMIALSRNCVLISASKILRELEENKAYFKANKHDQLVCGCSPLENEAWDMILIRVNRRDVVHRGYVLEGLPIIKNTAVPSVEEVSVSTTGAGDSQPAVTKKDSYLLVNMPKTNSDPSEETTDEPTCTCTTESSDRDKSLCSFLPSSHTESLFKCSLPETSTESSATCECSSLRVVDKCCKCSVQYQLDEVFNQWCMKPDIIINISCPDEEIIVKHSKVYCPPSSSGGEHVNKDSDVASDLANIPSNSIFDNVSFYSKIEYPLEKLEQELHNYKKYASKLIQGILLRHNPQNLVWLDGRYPFMHCFETVKIRLETLPLQTVLIPEKLAPARSNDSNESPSETNEDYEEESFESEADNLERAFEEIKSSGALSDKFQLKLSRWKFLCPVELAKGKKIEGSKKFAVRLMNWVFFLSSDEAMETFIENPRPYLLPPNPRPSCRIAVIGPRYSEKSRLSSNLAKNLDSLTVNVRNVVAHLSQGSDLSPNYSTLDLLDGKVPIESIVNRIAETVENIPEQNCYDFFRNRGWILDDVNLDYELCKRLLENDVSIETIIILFESYPYTKLLRNYDKLQAKTPCDDQAEDFEDFLDCLYEKKLDINDYKKELDYYNKNVRIIANKLANLGLDVLLCDHKDVDNLFEFATNYIRKDYGVPFKVFDTGEEEEENDEAESEGNETDDENKSFHFGDCNDYCPVSLLRHSTLLKGKSNYRCTIDDKVYFSSSEEALNDLIANFENLGVPFQRELGHIPPLKVFVVGYPGCGKSTLANLISREYGLISVDFFKNFADYMLHRGIDVEDFRAKYRRPSNIIPEYLREAELPENIDDVKYDTDKPVLGKFCCQYLKEGALIPPFMGKKIILNSFKNACLGYGVVMHSFPNNVHDFEYMMKSFAIPDVIIQLDCSTEDSKKRLLLKFLAGWKNDQDKMKKAEQIRYVNEMDDYYNKRERWLLVEKLKLIRKKREEQGIRNQTDSVILDLAASFTFSNFSSIADFGLLTMEDESELEKRYSAMYPEPEPFEDWETEEQALQRYLAQIEIDYEKAAANLSVVYEHVAHETIPIPWFEIDATPDIEKVFLKTLQILTPFVLKNSSFFEKTFVIENETAEYLLAFGYYFLSPFGRFCPIQVFKSENPFPMFLPLASQNEIFAVLHRQYVYFLAGKEALDQFRKEPLRYLKQDPYIPMVPALISIIGPPKCGKTTLCKRFSAAYKFEVISRSEVINYVLNNFPCTELTHRINQYVLLDNPVPSRYLCEAVSLFLSNLQCVTQGCVFDNFPSSIDEARQFVSVGIIPNVVIDLEAPLDFTLECFANDDKAPFTAQCHIDSYEHWKTDADLFRNWMNKCYGNVVKLNATISRAGVWYHANETVKHRFRKFLKYIRETGYDKVRNLEFSGITPTMIEERLSRYQLLCPGCIYFDQRYKSFDASTSREGLLEFRDHYYWFCRKHLKCFKAAPIVSLKRFDQLELPNDYPQLIFDTVDLDNICWSTRLANNGFCLVTYIDNLPDRVLELGKPSLAVHFQNRLYLFASEACRVKFCEKFPQYASIRIHLPKKLDPIDLSDLPIRGYLEQNVAALLVKAINKVGKVRPKIYGLSASASAAVYMSTYLMAHHPSPVQHLHEEALKQMEGRCQYLEAATRLMKEKLNPWLVHESDRDADTVASKRQAQEDTKSESSRIPSVKFQRVSDGSSDSESDTENNPN